MFLIVVKIWEPTVPPQGAPMEPLPGATFENPFRRPCLFIVTDFKPFLEMPVMFLIVVKIWEPMVPLQGATFEKSPPAPLLTYCGMLGINCTQISARKMNPGLMQHYFEWDSHGDPKMS